MGQYTTLAGYMIGEEDSRSDGYIPKIVLSEKREHMYDDKSGNPFVVHARGSTPEWGHYISPVCYMRDYRKTYVRAF